MCLVFFPLAADVLFGRKGDETSESFNFRRREGSKFAVLGFVLFKVLLFANE